MRFRENREIKSLEPIAENETEFEKPPPPPATEAVVKPVVHAFITMFAMVVVLFFAFQMIEINLRRL